MDFLKELTVNIYLTEEDSSGMPEQNIKELQQLIRKGAENSGAWSNALELVQKAYKIGKVERPTPSMQSAWKQYETMITYAVQQLGKFHGQNGTWRMTSESFKTKEKFVIKCNDDITEPKVMEAHSLDEIIDKFKKEYDYTIKTRFLEEATILELWEYDIINTGVKFEIKRSV